MTSASAGGTARDSFGSRRASRSAVVGHGNGRATIAELARVEHADDARMRDAPEPLRFGKEAPALAVGELDVVAQDFQRERFACAPGRVDDRGPAFAQHAGDLELSQCVWDGRLA